MPLDYRERDIAYATFEDRKAVDTAIGDKKANADTTKKH